MCQDYCAFQYLACSQNQKGRIPLCTATFDIPSFCCCLFFHLAGEAIKWKFTELISPSLFPPLFHSKERRVYFLYEIAYMFKLPSVINPFKVALFLLPFNSLFSEVCIFFKVKKLFIFTLDNLAWEKNSESTEKSCLHWSSCKNKEFPRWSRKYLFTDWSFLTAAHYCHQLQFGNNK